VTAPLWTAGSIRITLPSTIAVSRIDHGTLSDGHVRRLGSRDPEHRLERERLDDPGQLLTGRRPLAHLEGKFLQDAGRAGRDPHRGTPALLEAGDGPQALHLVSLNRQLALDRLLGDLQPAPLDLETVLQLFRPVLRGGELHAGDQPTFGQLPVHLDLSRGVAIVGLDAGNERFLGEALGFKGRLKIHEFGFGGRQLPLGIEPLELHIGVAQLDQSRVRFDLCSRLDVDRFDPTRGHGCDDPDLLRHEGPGTPDLAHHVPLSNAVDEDCGAIHRGSGGFETRKPHGDHDHGDDSRRREEVSTTFFRRVARYVHRRVLLPEGCVKSSACSALEVRGACRSRPNSQPLHMATLTKAGHILWSGEVSDSGMAASRERTVGS
jgi:hypothetical protein